MVEHGQKTQIHCKMVIQLLIMQTACADQSLELQEVSWDWWGDCYKSCPRLFLIQAWYSREDFQEVVVVTILSEAHGKVQLAEEPPRRAAEQQLLQGTRRGVMLPGYMAGQRREGDEVREGVKLPICKTWWLKPKVWILGTEWRLCGLKGCS